jgi:hypothetical protein
MWVTLGILTCGPRNLNSHMPGKPTTADKNPAIDLPQRSMAGFLSVQKDADHFNNKIFLVAACPPASSRTK